MVVENSEAPQKETSDEKIQKLSKLAEDLSVQIETLPKIAIGDDLPIEAIRLHLKYGKTLLKLHAISLRNYFSSFFAAETKPGGDNMDDELEIAFSVLEVVRIALEPKKNPDQISPKIRTKTDENCTEISGRNGANKNDTKIDETPKIIYEKRDKIESAGNKTEEKIIVEKKELLAVTYKSLANVFFECDDYENFIAESIKANQTFELLKNVTTLKTKQIEIDIKICAKFLNC